MTHPACSVRCVIRDQAGNPAAGAADSASAAEGSAAAAAATVAETQSALTRIAADLIRTQTLVTEHHAFS